jgi:hypothetical protein
MIDINGIDNVGKTYVGKILYQFLEEKFTVKLYGTIFPMLRNPKGYTEHEWFTKTPILERVSEIAESYKKRYKAVLQREDEFIIFDRGIGTVQISLISRLMAEGYSKINAKNIVNSLFSDIYIKDSDINVLIFPISLSQIQQKVGKYCSDYLSYQELFFDNFYVEENYRKTIMIPAYSKDEEIKRMLINEIGEII